MSTSPSETGISYAEDNRYIYRFEPPVPAVLDTVRLDNIRSNLCYVNPENGHVTAPNLVRSTVGRLEHVVALAVHGPDSWGTPDYEETVKEQRATLLDETTQDPNAVATRLSELLDGAHAVTFELEPSRKNISASPNCW